MTKKRGRPSTGAPQKDQIEDLYYVKRMPVSLIARKLGLSPATVYRHLALEGQSDPYLYKLRAEAIRRVEKEIKRMGSRHFHRGYTEMAEDYNPRLAKDEETIDAAMEIICEDSEDWAKFKRDLKIKLGDKEQSKLSKREIERSFSTEKTGALTEQELEGVKEAMSLFKKR